MKSENREPRMVRQLRASDGDEERRKTALRHLRGADSQLPEKAGERKGATRRANESVGGER